MGVPTRYFKVGRHFQDGGRFSKACFICLMLGQKKIRFKVSPKMFSSQDPNGSIDNI